MAKLQLDLSGINGLVERHQGDLNDTAAQPHLRYLGASGQMADGIYNPFKILGFMSPANNVFTSLTGTISAPIVASTYDSEEDIVYLAENSENILQLAGLDDTSVAAYKTLTTGLDIEDMLLHEVAGKKALIYALNSGTTLEAGGDGIHLGFTFLGGENTTIFDTDVISSSNNSYLSEIVNTASESYGSGSAKRMSQQFDADDLFGLTVHGVKLAISRELGTGSGITLKVSLQGDAVYNTGSYTSRGIWSNSVTDYAVNDTVTKSGEIYQCIQAHSAVAVTTEEPGVGSAWEDYWNYFGAPNGTELASGTFTLDQLQNLTNTDDDRFTVLFSAPYTLTANTLYWIVIEEVGTNMTASDSMSWLQTVNGNGNYARHAKLYLTTPGCWKSLNQAGDTLLTNHDNFDLALVLTESEHLSDVAANGSFTQEIGDFQFLHLADNSLVYWVIDNAVHTFDGSLIGGDTGTMTENVLVFPSYMRVTDIAETRSRMYIGLQSSVRTIPTTAASKDYKYFPANTAGIFVWDRRSQVTGSTDFVICPGAKEIKALFTGHDGSVYAITESNSGFGEIRTASGNQFAVIQTFERFGFPRDRHAVKTIASGLAIWAGANGIIYAYGSIAPGTKPALYKIGKHSTGVDDNVKIGNLFVGHEESAAPRIAALIGVDSGLKKWYPNGAGTISSVVQTANQGNVYTKVELLPPNTNVNHLKVFGIPTTTATTDDIANVKIYFNLSSTPWATKVITKKEMNKGYYEVQINKQNIFAVQIEVEWPTDETIGSDTFCPMYALIDYTPVETSGGKS
jgi:hypothetical protein